MEKWLMFERLNTIALTKWGSHWCSILHVWKRLKTINKNERKKKMWKALEVTEAVCDMFSFFFFFFYYQNCGSVSFKHCCTFEKKPLFSSNKSPLQKKKKKSVNTLTHTCTRQKHCVHTSLQAAEILTDPFWQTGRSEQGEWWRGRQRDKEWRGEE